MLSRDDHDTVLFDEDKEKLNAISLTLDFMTVSGGTLSISDNTESGENSCDLFIGVTPYEVRNIVTCQLAKYLEAKNGCTNLQP